MPPAGVTCVLFLYLPAGPLATTRLDSMLLVRGLIVGAAFGRWRRRRGRRGRGSRKSFSCSPTLAEKLPLPFDATYPEHHRRGNPKRLVGRVNCCNSTASSMPTVKAPQDLTKQEGIIFRHFLRFNTVVRRVFGGLPRAGIELPAWQAELRSMSDRVTCSCRLPSTRPAPMK